MSNAPLLSLHNKHAKHNTHASTVPFYPDYLKTPNAKDVCSILNMFNTSINNIYFLQP